MKKILVFTDYYLPGFKSGGGMRTIVNMVERLGDRFDFRIMTRGYDSGDKTTYPGIAIDGWNKIGKAQVYHASHNGLTFGAVRRLLKAVEPDAIYLNSFFSPLAIRCLVLRRLGIAPDVPVILAPEGEFSVGALSLKATKKKVFGSIAVPGKLYHDVIWKAAGEPEKEDIRRMVGEGCEIFVAPNMPPRTMFEEYDFSAKPPKEKGSVQLVFLSRVVRKKNVHHTIEMLAGVRGKVELDIYGPLEDMTYWQECLAKVAALPAEITVTHRGSVAHNVVAAQMSNYHFFVLPTLGENFGHVMVEAFAAGCPVLISDQTPWLNLPEKDLGWDLPLDRHDLWREALQTCVDMDGERYSQMAGTVRKYATDWLSSEDVERATEVVLERAIRDGKSSLVPSAA